MATFRRLKEDFREFPATMTLGTLWVVVFALMVGVQLTRPAGLSPGGLLVGVHNGHRFGDMSLQEIYAGEYWRAVTATFVHYGLVHIGMNLFALYQIGCLVESWYGPGPFVGIYVLTGGLGNLVSAAIRHALGASPYVTSAGGSTVIMGLVALCAVVGWRAGTRVGDHLKNQMIWVIGLTAALGAGTEVSGLPVIDNWGHFGGTVVGAAVGLAHLAMLRRVGLMSSKVVGWVGAAVLAACAAAQVADDRSEDASHRTRTAEQARLRLAQDERLLVRLDEVRQVYRAVVAPRAVRRGSFERDVPPKARPAPSAAPPKADARVATKAPVVPGRAPGAAPAPTSYVFIDAEQEFYLTVLNAAGRSLVSMSGELDGGATSSDFRRARDLLGQTIAEPPTLDEIREFDDHLAAVEDHVRKDRDAARLLATAPADGPTAD